jgi:hypothetical protein
LAGRPSPLLTKERGSWGEVSLYVIFLTTPLTSPLLKGMVGWGLKKYKMVAHKII